MLSQEQIDLLKRTVCKEATNDQFMLFMGICDRTRMDPFRKQIYAVFYHNDESRAGKGPKDMVIIVGIDGYRMMAARDHKDFGGTSSAKFTWFDPEKRTPRADKLIPESATVTAYRKGGTSAEITVYWEEYAPADMNHSRADFWRRMPKLMLEKCAEAKALRKGFPGMNDLYIREELAQRDEEQTNGGREITDPDGFTAHGTPATFQARLQSGRERAQEIAKEKTEELKESIAEHAAVKLDERRANEKPKAEADKPAIDVKPTAVQEFRNVELDLTTPDDPIIRGEIAEVVEMLQKYVTMEWRGDWWHFRPKDMDTLLSFFDHCNEKIGAQGRLFKIRHIFPKKVQSSPPATAEVKTTAKEPVKAKRPAAAPAEPPSLIKGVLIRCDAGMVRQGTTPTRQVKINSAYYACYRNTLFPYLDKYVGKNIEGYIDKRKQLVGLKSLGPLSFDDDGVTPVIQNSQREAGQKTLY